MIKSITIRVNPDIPVCMKLDNASTDQLNGVIVSNNRASVSSRTIGKNIRLYFYDSFNNITSFKSPCKKFLNFSNEENSAKNNDFNIVCQIEQKINHSNNDNNISSNQLNNIRSHNSINISSHVNNISNHKSIINSDHLNNISKHISNNDSSHLNNVGNHDSIRNRNNHSIIKIIQNRIQYY